MAADASPFNLALELASNSAPLLSSVQPPDWSLESARSCARSLPDGEHSPSVDPLDEIDVTGLDELEGRFGPDGHSDIDASPTAPVDLAVLAETILSIAELSPNGRDGSVPVHSVLLR